MNQRIPAVSTDHHTIAVTGARGQLGHRLCQRLGQRAIPLDRSSFDLLNPAQMADQVARLHPQVLINCAAYTAVDAAESDPSTCMAVNRDAVQTLVETTQAVDCAFVQISTDYVFGGTPWLGRPYRESDPIAPQGVYAQSKAAAEGQAREHPEHLIIRTCGIYGPVSPNESGNFVNTMLRLGHERESLRIVDDQVCCPTYVNELADAILHLIQHRERGTFHVVNRQALSWCDFAREIFRLAKLDCDIEPISSEEYGAAAPRPLQSALDVARYEATGGPRLSTCVGAVARYLASRKSETQPDASTSG